MIFKRFYSGFLTLCLALALLTAAWPTLAKKNRPEANIPPLPLSITVAHEGGRAVRDEAWIDAQVAEAGRLFGECGVHFRKASVRALDNRFARLETRADRDGLATELEKGHINVMVVSSLRDVDDPTLYRMGVHWRPQSNLKKHYVIIAASALPSTLAHELGHFFGNGHSKVVNNVMSYERSGDSIFFDARQRAKIQAFAKIYLHSKEIVP